ncbi:hypothetical protein B0H11DRAFT_1924468 [Mycena galericulata]|nr:hypothetical protein B0H11DRAFT_1924468 [Mycena galericulata]
MGSAPRILLFSPHPKLRMEEEGHVQIMYPHLARRRYRTRPPAPPRSRPIQSPYGHGLDGTNAPPIIVTRPAAYRKRAAAPSGTSGADQALRDSDALLLARLAESKEKQEKRRLKRKAASDDAHPTKRPKTQ